MASPAVMARRKRELLAQLRADAGLCERKNFSSKTRTFNDEAVEVMNRMTQQVADASREQKQGGDLVVKAVERIAQIAQQNLSAAEQLSTNTQNLTQEAERLLSVAELFTLEGEEVEAEDVDAVEEEEILETYDDEV